MANYLILNKPQVFNGLGTLTYSVTTTEALNVQVQVTFPEAVAINSNLAGDSYSGAGSGVGLGAGRSPLLDRDFTDGDMGLGYGGSGYGFEEAVSYPQPPAAGSNATANNPITSQLSIVVNQNGSPIYTSTAPAVAQSALQFKKSFLASSGDTITVVLSSAASSDNQLSGVTSTISVGQGL